MRTTVELSERNYVRLRAKAAERGLRGFSKLVEEALDHYLDAEGRDDAYAAILEAEGSWSDRDIEEWERTRREVWASWQTDPSSTRTS